VIDTIRSTRAVLLVGISGAGKNVIQDRLLKTDNYYHIVSHTTRKPRMNKGVMEQEGAPYHFVDKPTMIEMVKRHEFVEVNLYSDNLYGMNGSEFKQAGDEGRIALTDVEVNGVADVVRIASDAIRPIFLVPPSYDVWNSRWQQRYGANHEDHTEDLARRKETAVEELKQGLTMSYYFPVVNDDLEEAIREVDQIAQTGVQSDASRQAGIDAIEDILRGLGDQQIL
jgi:guanylate kinase